MEIMSINSNIRWCIIEPNYGWAKVFSNKSDAIKDFGKQLLEGVLQYEDLDCSEDNPPRDIILAKVLITLSEKEVSVGRPKIEKLKTKMTNVICKKIREQIIETDPSITVIAKTNYDEIESGEKDDR